MPVTREQAQMLATLAVAARPTGAPRWDPAGVFAAIGKIKQLALADVAMAVMRAAADRTLETPGAIANLRSSAWSERVTKAEQRQPPKRDEECHHHPGEWPDACRGCAADRLTAEQQTQDERRKLHVVATEAPEAYRQARLALVPSKTDRRPYVPETPEEGE